VTPHKLNNTPPCQMGTQPTGSVPLIAVLALGLPPVCLRRGRPEADTLPLALLDARLLYPSLLVRYNNDLLRRWKLTERVFSLVVLMMTHNSDRRAGVHILNSSTLFSMQPQPLAPPLGALVDVSLCVFFEMDFPDCATHTRALWTPGQQPSTSAPPHPPHLPAPHLKPQTRAPATAAPSYLFSRRARVGVPLASCTVAGTLY